VLEPNEKGPIVRKLCLLGATGIAVAATAVPAFAAIRTITVGDNYFVRKGKPPTVTVKRGTTVKWVWRGSSFHNVTVTRGPVKFHSRTMSKGSFSRKLTRKGTYTIVCTIHLASSNQKMTLRVR
jgi:plastocyanin